MGILALPFRPLYSNISLLSFLLFLRDWKVSINVCVQMMFHKRGLRFPALNPSFLGESNLADVFVDVAKKKVWFLASTYNY